jgi:hypothetical protein
VARSRVLAKLDAGVNLIHIRGLALPAQLRAKEVRLINMKRWESRDCLPGPFVDTLDRAIARAKRTGVPAGFESVHSG